VLVAASLLAGGLTAIAIPTGAGHLDLDQVHRETVEGSGSFGITAVTETDGPVRATATGYEPTDSTPLSGGVVLFDEDGNSEGIVAITVHRSPDRLVVQPTPGVTEPASTPEDPGVWATRAAADETLLEDTEITLEIQPTDDASSSDSAEAIATIGVTQLGAEAGTHHVGLWLGEVDQTQLTVSTSAEVDRVDTHTEDAHVAGDRDLERGVNVEAQTQPADASLLVSGLDPTIGAKALVDASTTATTEEATYGFWGLAENREVCSYVAGVCVFPQASALPCPDPIPVPCNTASLSWQGPDDRASGGELFSFRAAQPGAYEFTVDHKVDVYGPKYGDWDTGTRAVWHEHFSYLTLGEIQLPGPATAR
jgi:hypothetical protein